MEFQPKRTADAGEGETEASPSFFRNVFTIPMCRWLWILLLMVLAVARVHTVVSGQDPHMIYLPEARLLVTESFSGGELQRIGNHFMPGWPLILGLACHLFGPLGHLFTGYAIAILSLWAPLVLLRRCGVDRIEAEGAVMLGLVWLWVTSPFHASMMLWAFRDLPSIGIAMFGLALCTGTRPRPFLAALLLCFAAALRETALVAMPAALLLLLWEREGRGRRVLLFLTPILVGLGALFAVLGATHQVERVLGTMFGRASGTWSGLTWSVLSLRELLVIPLVVLAAARPRLGVAFALPALLLYAVYVCSPPHPRYGLGVMIWLAPLLLPGASRLLRIRNLPRTFAPWAWVGVSLLLLLVVFRLQPWGEAVSIADMRNMRRQVHDVVKPGDRVVVEHHGRLGYAGLFGYTRARPVEVNRVGHALADEQRVFYLFPLNPAAIYPPPRGQQAGMSVSARLSSSFDLLPRENRDGDAWSVRLGAAHYGMHEVVLPGRDEIDLPIGAGDADDKLFCLRPTGAGRIHLEVEQQRIADWNVPPGKGEVWLLRSQAPPVSGDGILSIRASGFLWRHHLLAAEDDPSRLRTIWLDARREGIASTWFGQDWLRFPPAAKYGYGLKDGMEGTLRLPRLVMADGDEAFEGLGHLEIRLGFRPAMTGFRPVRLGWRTDDGAWQWQPQASGAEQFLLQCELPLPLPEQLTVRLEGHGTGIHAVSLQVRLR